MPDPNAPPGSSDASYGHGFNSFSLRDMEIAAALGAFGGLYGAIAYSPSTQRRGWSTRATDEATADTVALNDCGTRDAVIVARGNSQYLALAVADGGAYGGASGISPKYASKRALQTCGGANGRILVAIDTRQMGSETHGGRPAVVPWWRGRPHRWVPLALVVFAIGAFGSGGVFGSGNSDNPQGEIVLGVICLVVAALMIVFWRPKGARQ